MPDTTMYTATFLTRAYNSQASALCCITVFTASRPHRCKSLSLLLSCPHPSTHGTHARHHHPKTGAASCPVMPSVPCGHTCKLRCHAYDKDHSRQFCDEPVLDFCEEGHVITRRCGDTDAECSTCVDIRQLLEREKGQRLKLVRCCTRSAVGCAAVKPAVVIVCCGAHPFLGMNVCVYSTASLRWCPSELASQQQRCHLVA